MWQGRLYLATDRTGEAVTIAERAVTILEEQGDQEVWDLPEARLVLGAARARSGDPGGRREVEEAHRELLGQRRGTDPLTRWAGRELDRLAS